VEISSSEEDEDSDLIMMPSDAEIEEEDEDEGDVENSGSHVNDALNQRDAMGGVLVNVGHPASEPDIYLAPQLAAIVKPHQVIVLIIIANFAILLPTKKPHVGPRSYKNWAFFVFMRPEVIIRCVQNLR